MHKRGKTKTKIRIQLQNNFFEAKNFLVFPFLLPLFLQSLTGKNRSEMPGGVSSRDPGDPLPVAALTLTVSCWVASVHCVTGCVFAATRQSRFCSLAHPARQREPDCLEQGVGGVRLDLHLKKMLLCKLKGNKSGKVNLAKRLSRSSVSKQCRVKPRIHLILIT